MTMEKVVFTLFSMQSVKSGKEKVRANRSGFWVNCATNFIRFTSL